MERDAGRRVCGGDWEGVFILGVFYSEYANRPSPLSTNGHLLVVVAHHSRKTGVQDAFSLFFMPKMKNPLEGERNGTGQNELI